MEDSYNNIVIGMTASLVDMSTKTIKVRIPQYHGLPGNPEEYKVDYYVDDKDLPDAMIMAPIGRDILSVYNLLDQIGTLVYIQFSEGELGYPIVVGWVPGSGVHGNTVYSDPSEIRSYNISSGTVKNTYNGKVYNNLTGDPGEAAPNSWFILPYAGATLNWEFAPYRPFGYLERHGGIDLGGQEAGYPVYAIHDSIVSAIYSEDYSMGNAVFTTGYDKDPDEPDAKSIQVQYMHLNAFAEGLTVGQSLNKGDLIGYLGSSGSTTGIHLHLGIKYLEGDHAGQLRDPALVMGITDWQSGYEWYDDQPLSANTTNGVYSPYTDQIVPISSGHYTIRTLGVNAVVIHYVVGVVYDGANVVADWENREYSSSNYVIDVNGNITGVVPENLRAFTSGSAPLGDRDIDNRAITIECSNNNYGPEYTYSEATIDALVKLLWDIGQRYNITWNYTGDESGNVHEHKWYQATDCPGPVLESMLGEIATRANNYEP